MTRPIPELQGCPALWALRHNALPLKGTTESPAIRCLLVEGHQPLPTDSAIFSDGMGRPPPKAMSSWILSINNYRSLFLLV
jgi:hypothetical protein